MSSGDSSDPHQRGSTDQSLKVERDKTDAELGSRMDDIRDVAIELVTEARDKADSVLSEARELEDQKRLTPSQEEVLTAERAREDALLGRQRVGADAVARDERERRQLALVSLLKFEREHTDLQLETERERVDQALATREDFMAMVSHDLRSLLGGIALSAEMLQGVDAGTFDRVKHYAGAIQRFTARMNRLVGDLMDVTSIEIGKLDVVLKPRELSALLADAVEAFEPAARLQGIELRCEPTTEVAWIEIDHERILQVLANLVGNALKFTKKGGRIVISVARREREVCFAVSDTGEGIPEQLLAKIFERHFQATPSDRRGLGLGLFIAQSIVVQHGGSLWVESKLGQGSTFYFTIPTKTGA